MIIGNILLPIETKAYGNPYRERHNASKTFVLGKTETKDKTNLQFRMSNFTFIERTKM